MHGGEQIFAIGLGAVALGILWFIADAQTVLRMHGRMGASDDSFDAFADSDSRTAALANEVFAGGDEGQRRKLDGGGREIGRRPSNISHSTSSVSHSEQGSN